MSKYSEDQLKSMAEETINAKASNDPRYPLLIMEMMMRTGLSKEAVEYKIKELSETGKTL